MAIPSIPFGHSDRMKALIAARADLKSDSFLAARTVQAIGWLRWRVIRNPRLCAQRHRQLCPVTFSCLGGDTVCPPKPTLCSARDFNASLIPRFARWLIVLGYTPNTN